MEERESVEENNNVTFNEVFSAKPWVGLRSGVESKGEGNTAPLWDAVLDFRRPECLSGAPQGWERADLQCWTCSPSFFQSILPHVYFTYWLSLRFHLKELGGKKRKTFFKEKLSGGKSIKDRHRKGENIKTKTSNRLVF